MPGAGTDGWRNWAGNQRATGIEIVHPGEVRTAQGTTWPPFDAAQIDLVAAHRDALLNTVDLALAVGGGLGERAEQPEQLSRR